MAKHVDYFVSLNSPWTYLGSARFDAMAAKYGAEVTIWPVSFGDVFAVSGGLPLPKRAPQRQAYRMMELKRWRDFLGMKLTLHPKFFPGPADRASHLIIAADRQGLDALRLAQAILTAVWAEERDGGDAATLAAIASENGMDGAALARASEDQAIKRQFDAWTDEAIARNVFGAPTFAIDGELFWGQDRLDFVERKLTQG